MPLEMGDADQSVRIGDFGAYGNGLEMLLIYIAGRFYSRYIFVYLHSFTACIAVQERTSQGAITPSRKAYV